VSSECLFASRSMHPDTQFLPSSSLLFWSKNSPNTRSGSLGLLISTISYLPILPFPPKVESTYCSLPTFFIPSSSAGVTRLLRYCRTWAPWGAAWEGIAADDDDDDDDWSGCTDWAREPVPAGCCCSLRRGVPVLVVVVFAGGAGD